MAATPPAPASVSSTPAPPAPNPEPAPAPPTRGGGALAGIVLVVALLAAAAFAWSQWRERQASARDAAADADLRLQALEGRVDGLRRDQRAQTGRLQQADATNRVLRDELLGIGQRAALIEDTVAKLADPDRHGAQALRLDEAELLLVMGQQRLMIAADLDGARRAYALAAGVLDGIDDPAYLSLRQTLIQERAGLDALEAEPRVVAMARLDAFATTALSASTARRADARDARPWWRRAFGSLLDARPSVGAVAIEPSDRAAAQAALQLELSIARAAAERRDVDGYRAALRRAGGWIERLSDDAALAAERRAQLEALAALPLSPAVPTLGSTLEQLRQMRASR